MINRLVGAATLFTASAIFLSGSQQLAATPLATSGTDAAVMQNGDCGDKDMKKDPAAPADSKAPAKAKDGSCGKGSCGAKDMKKGKKDGTCGKDKGKKDGTCGKDKGKKDGSCGKDKKEASCGADKK